MKLVKKQDSKKCKACQMNADQNQADVYIYQFDQNQTWNHGQ